MRTLGWFSLAFTLFFSCLVVVPAMAQEDSWQGPEKGPQLKAHLVDKEKNAARRIAVVEVTCGTLH